jgi:glutathione synthase/RimK-type ligase-like ATP-grasp enzyme
MKIGIHHTSGFFSERWIEYCETNDIEYKLVNCYDNDIIHQLADCDGLMWHFMHKSARDSKFAKQLLFSIEASGKKVFPDYRTVWHFDDKVGQKYLMEAIDAPFVNSYVFYTKKEAIEWLDRTTLPKVFKLRNGAGSENVRLVKSAKHAEKLIRRAFNKGFKHYDAWRSLEERYRKYRQGKSAFLDVIKGVFRILISTEYGKMTGNEKGYVYFQDFIPGNDSDIRVVVIGDKAFAIKRLVRKNDFRASGSGTILYEKEHFDVDTIRIAFNISEKLNVQCMAYDFVFLDGQPLVIEISYGFSMKGYDACVGYWDKDMTWNEGKFDPYGWMVEEFLKE